MNFVSITIGCGSCRCRSSTACSINMPSKIQNEFYMFQLFQVFACTSLEEGSSQMVSSPEVIQSLDLVISFSLQKRVTSRLEGRGMCRSCRTFP